MGLFLICFLISWFLRPWLVAFFWLLVYTVPFVAFYEHGPTSFVAAMFLISALLTMSRLYAFGLMVTIMLMLVSSAAVAVFAFVTSHPDQIAVVAAGVLAIIVFFIQRKPLVKANEHPYENGRRLAVTFHPHPNIAQSPELIAHEGGPPGSEKPS